MNHLKEEGRIHDFVSKLITDRIALNKGGAVFFVEEYNRNAIMMGDKQTGGALCWQK